MPPYAILTLLSTSLFVSAVTDLCYAIYLAWRLNHQLYADGVDYSVVPLSWILADSLWLLLATISLEYASLASFFGHRAGECSETRILRLLSTHYEHRGLISVLLPLAISAIAGLRVLFNTKAKYMDLIDIGRGWGESDGSIQVLAKILEVDGAWCNGPRDMVRAGLVLLMLLLVIWVGVSRACATVGAGHVGAK